VRLHHLGEAIHVSSAMEENTVSRSHIALRDEVSFAAQDDERNKPDSTGLERRNLYVVF
jgi:hypothetical protein